jgi:hypothetical protein
MFSKPGEEVMYSKNYAMPENSETDADGRFRHPGLFPGMKHHLDSLAPRTSRGVPVGGHIDPLKPGETRDLGSLTLPRE